jgi:hypothetical protein
MRCRVFIDESLAGQAFKFATVPHIGEHIRIARFGNPQLYLVTSVIHVAEGVYEEHPKAHALVRVSSNDTAP